MIVSLYQLVAVAAATISLAVIAPIASAESQTPLRFDRKESFQLKNRLIDLQSDGVAHLNANEGEGLAWISGEQFVEGRLSIEVKGKDEPGRSFVGIAFHGSEDLERFEAVYVRPFNFQASTTERRSHSLQYMSIPEYSWAILRERFPGKYEAGLTPAPAADDWVRLTLEVKQNVLRVYVDDVATPALTVKLLGTHSGNAIALWVGNGSEGWFRNLQIEASSR